MKAVIAILILAAGVCVFILLSSFIRMSRRPVIKLYEKRSLQGDFTPLSDIPERGYKLMVLVEDKNFFTHRGYDPQKIRLALKRNLREKRLAAGGSSISQQLAKNLYFRFKRSIFRKASELLCAMRIERLLSKKEILEFYLNIIYFGNDIYGITDAARYYFGKTVREMTVNQFLMLGCIIAAPTRANPIQYPEVYERIRNQHLDRITGEGMTILTDEEVSLIRSYTADCLDPELRKEGRYPKHNVHYIPQINARFGPYEADYHNPLDVEPVSDTVGI